MKTTPELLEAWKDAAERAIEHGHPIDWSVERKPKHIIRDLIADLEEAQEQLASPFMSGYEAAKEEYRPQIIAAEAELAATRKKLADTQEALLAERNRREHFLEMANGIGCDSLTDVFRLVSRMTKQLAEAQSRDGSIAPVAAIKFSLKTDCGDQFLRCWVEGSFDAIRSEWPEVPEAVFIGADPLHPNTQQTSTASLDAAIAEAIADEKRNPWKQAIINELAVSYVLHTDHETDPVRALAALVDYECKVALDPAVSKEAQALIEPYHKDAERYRWLTNDHDSPDTRKACHDISARIPVMSYSAASQAIDAAIAAKGENE
jgi:hypothetical protein